MVEAAQAAGRTKTYPGAQYRRLARRIGAKRAAMAVAHSIAVITHHVIKDGQHFVDLGHKVTSNPPEHPIFRIMTRRSEVVKSSIRMLTVPGRCPAAHTIQGE